MKRYAELVDGILTKITKAIAFIAGIAALSTMFLITADVTGRYIFNHPLRGTFELVELSLVLIVFLALAYSELVGEGHIRVTILTDRLSGLPSLITQIVCSLIGIVTCTLLSWRNALYSIDTLTSKETSLMIHVPIWPFRLAIAIGTGLLALAFIITLIRTLKAKIKG